MPMQLLSRFRVAPGANFGDDVAIFEPTHGSAPGSRRSFRIQPVFAVWSNAFAHIGLEKAADVLEGAIEETVDRRLLPMIWQDKWRMFVPLNAQSLGRQ